MREAGPQVTAHEYRCHGGGITFQKPIAIPSHALSTMSLSCCNLYFLTFFCTKRSELAAFWQVTDVYLVELCFTLFTSHQGLLLVPYDRHHHFSFRALPALGRPGSPAWKTAAANSDKTGPVVRSHITKRFGQISTGRQYEPKNLDSVR